MANIYKKLKDPKALFILQFLLDALKPLREFELLFQKSGCLIPELYSSIVHLYKHWIVRFIKLSCIEKVCWKTDVDNQANWLKIYNIVMGAAAHKTFCDMTSEDQQEVVKAVKAFYLTGSQKLMDYMPFDNTFLRSCKFLLPLQEIQSSKYFEKWVTNVAGAMPAVIKEDELASLTVEIRLHQLSLSELNESTQNISTYWGSVEQTGKFPLLTKLAKAVFILPHGNADFERTFSLLSDILTKKRMCLKPETVRALVVSKSILSAKLWDNTNIPICPALSEKVASAYACHQRMKRDEQQLQEAQRVKELEDKLQSEIALQKKADRSIKKVDDLVKANEAAVEKQLDEKEKFQRLLKEAQEQAIKSDEKLEELRRQQASLKKKKEKASQNVVKDVLKRFSNFSDLP